MRSCHDSWYIMTNLEGKIPQSVAPLSSLRNWIEYGFKQIKVVPLADFQSQRAARLHCADELGWADFRVTDYASIERWWEIVMSAYLLVSLQANYFQERNYLSFQRRVLDSVNL